VQPGVSGVVSQRYLRPEYNGTVIFLIALDFRTLADESQKRSPTGLPEFGAFREAAGTPRCVVSFNFLARHNLKVGDSFAIAGPGGPVNLTIAAAIRDYSWSRGTVFLDKPIYADLFADSQTDVCHVFLNDPNDASGVRRFCDQRSLLRQDRPQIRRFFADLVERVYLFAYLQQIVVGIVATLGVVTALLISVLQRKRELGLLLAVGATPGQVLRSVLAEAAFMGLFGTVLGALVGIPLEWYVVEVILREETGFVFDTIVPWKAGAGIAAGAVLMATLAGLLPALHAVRTRIPEALQYE
jgi:putative ABC transport system permease protein